MSNPFATTEMALGYANSRPPVHPLVLDLVVLGAREDGTLPPRLRVLDVGCGAGISTRALLPLGDQVVGMEPAEAMLRLGPAIARGADFAVGEAEQLPFAAKSFDWITAAGSLNYVDLDRFFSRSPAGAERERHAGGL